MVLGGPLQYYLSVEGLKDTRGQAVLWMLCFPVVGAAWRLGLWMAARIAGGTVAYADVLRGLWWTALPLVLPLPFTALGLGSSDGSFDLHLLIEACLRRQFVNPPHWLVSVYWSATVVAGAGEAWAAWRVMDRRAPWTRVILLGATLIGLLLFVFGMGGLLLRFRTHWTG